MSAMKPAHAIRVGDVILPPARELRLWMRRTLAEKGLAESALHLEVTEVKEGMPDKNGPWLLIRGRYSREWTADYAKPDGEHFMQMKVRPNTPWPVIEGRE